MISRTLTQAKTLKRRCRIGRAGCVALAAIAVLVVNGALCVALAQEGLPADAFWPQWRGPLGTGGAVEGNPPVHWGDAAAHDETEGGLFSRLRRRNMGTTGPAGVQRYVVMALARSEGRVLWERIAVEASPHKDRHGTGSWASPSGVAAGEQFYAFFGSRGLYCYDHDGTLLWKRDLGDLQILMQFGEGASPGLYGDTIVVT